MSWHRMWETCEKTMCVYWHSAQILWLNTPSQKYKYFKILRNAPSGGLGFSGILYIKFKRIMSKI